MTAVPRAPELRPALHGGTALAAARELRLRVEGGELVLHLPGGERRVVAPAGSATRTLLLTAEQELRVLGRKRVAWGALLVTVDGSPRAVLRLLDFAPPKTQGIAQELPWASGAVSVASALGTALEPVPDDELARWGRRALRGLLVDPVPRPPTPGRWTPQVLVLAGFLTFLSYPAGGDSRVVVPAALGLLVAAWPISAQTRYRRKGHAGLLAPPPVVPGAVELAPVPAFPVPRAFKDSRLFLTPDVVVLRLYGQECWLPGPARGGVARAGVTRGATSLLDGGDRTVAVLLQPLWYATLEAEQAMVEAFTSAGIRVDHVPLGELGPELVRGLRPDGLGLLQLPYRQRGDITFGSAYFSLFVSVMLLFAAVAVAAWNPVAGAVYAGLVLALGIPLWVSGVTQSRLFRRAKRLVP